MAAKTGTYTLIASNTLGSNQSSVTLSSIPSNYTDLVIVFNGQTSSATYDVWIQVNGDTGTNYSSTQLYGTGSAAGSIRYSTQSHGTTWNTSTSNQTAIININDYSNTTTYKTLLCRGGNPSNGYVNADVILWRSTAAINSVTIYLSGAGTFSSGSTFKLYGIEAGNL